MLSTAVFDSSHCAEPSVDPSAVSWIASWVRNFFRWFGIAKAGWLAMKRMMAFCFVRQFQQRVDMKFESCAFCGHDSFIFDSKATLSSDLDSILGASNS